MFSSIKTNGVAIIGAGLGGAALALALHRQSITCRILEERSENSDILSSGVTLTPHGCQVFDKLGSLNSVEYKGYICEYRATKDADDKTVRKMRIASDTCHCYRLYRLAVLQEMKTALAESKVPIFYSMELEKIISDTADDVVFQVGDRTQSAAMVIGSDGIHSTLRRHITDPVPVYTNLLCVYGHIPTESVQRPDQDFAADLMVGTQFSYPEADRKGWETLASDPASLAALLRKEYDQWYDTAEHAIDELCKRPESILCWPFYAMPKLSSWSSSSGNVIMIGDAAHAMPASSGQGVNQALEDTFSLAKVLSDEWIDVALPSVLSTWQSWRQDKVDRIHEVLRVTNMMRSSEVERANLMQAADKEQSAKVDMQWLYDLDLDTLEAKLADQRNI